MRANRPALYSILKPDTSSDSPSAKSNGVRLVSARLVMNHKIEIGNKIISIGVNWLRFINVKSNVDKKIKAQIRISDILTSYEMVCATLRRAPSSAYFEFEHQPPRNIV